VGLQAAIEERTPRPRKVMRMMKRRGVKFMVSRVCASISSLVVL
jgi:predicted peroxiredoxin